MQMCPPIQQIMDQIGRAEEEMAASPIPQLEPLRMQTALGDEALRKIFRNVLQLCMPAEISSASVSAGNGMPIAEGVEDTVPVTIVGVISKSVGR